MTTTGGSSGGSGSSSSSNDRDRRRVNEVNPTQNLTGSFSGGSAFIDRPAPEAHKGSADDGKSVINIRPSDTSIVGGASSTPPQAHMGSDGGGGDGKGRGGAVDTTVTQKPTPNGSGEGAEGTVVTNGPRSDFSVVLAGQVGRRPDRSAARSNNFVSLVGGAGGLGRKTSQAKRSLIGGA